MFDVNAKLGHWPFRPVQGLDELLRRMDRLGIERAVVSSLNAVFYLNPQDGNDEVAAWVKGHRDRLVPWAVLRPNFAGCEDDLTRCVDDYGMRGLVLHPNYHRYSLDDPRLEPLMGLAAAWSLPVGVQVSLEDPRRQFDREIVMDVLPERIGDFARAYPAATVIALGIKIGQPERVGDPLPDNFLFDISNYETMDEIESAVERFGSDKTLFGTSFPFFNTQANVDKLKLAAIEDSDRQRIAFINANHLLPASE